MSTDDFLALPSHPEGYCVYRKQWRYKRRWTIERAIAWLGNFRRLLIRWERYPHIFQAFIHVACIMILLRRLLNHL